MSSSADERNKVEQESDGEKAPAGEPEFRLRDFFFGYSPISIIPQPEFDPTANPFFGRSTNESQLIR